MHLDHGAVAIDNNLIERQIKPWKLGAKNWLFAGSALAGQRAGVVMSYVRDAHKLTGLSESKYPPVESGGESSDLLTES